MTSGTKKIEDSIPTLELPPVIKNRWGESYWVPEDTNMLPFLDFLIEATKRSPIIAGLFGGGALLSGIIGYFIMPMMSLYLVLGVAIGYYFFLDSYSTRRQLVFRKGEMSETYLDEQKWWKADSEFFPDGAKYVHKNKRVGVWEVVGSDGIRPFDAWVAPVSSDSVEGSEVGNITAMMRGAKDIASHRELTQNEKLAMGMFALIIVVCFIAVILASGQIGEMQNGDGNTPTETPTTGISINPAPQ